MGRDTPLVYQWDNIWKLFLQKHLHSTETHKTHVFIALCIISLQDIFACFLFFQTSLVAERAGRLQCQLRKFSFCSCTPSFSCLVFLLLGPAIHPCRHFLLLTHWLMFKEDKQHAPHPPPSKPSTHTNTLTEHTALNSPVWMGLTSHPVAGTTGPARGNLPIDKRVREGQTL